MNSPVKELIKQLVSFDKSSIQPLYIQVAQQIINGIQRGYLAKGSKLPGTRVLSDILNIHRNTSVAIYDELASQGWVEIIANKGTFVLVPEQKRANIKARFTPIGNVNNYSKTTGFPFQSAFHVRRYRQESHRRRRTQRWDTQRSAWPRCATAPGKPHLGQRNRFRS